jgi:hypothetical protein
LRAGDLTVCPLVNTTLCAMPPKAGKSRPQKWRPIVERRKPLAGFTTDVDLLQQW